MKLKILISFMVFALIGLLVGGNTIAYFTDTVKEELVKFVAGTVEIEFDSKPVIESASPFVVNQGVTWSIKNTGTNEVFLRAKVNILDDENIFENVKFGVEESDWKVGKDGYYYYSKAVGLNESVEFPLEVIFDDVWESVNIPIDNLNIEVEAIQASNDARKLHWSDNPFE